MTGSPSPAGHARLAGLTAPEGIPLLVVHGLSTFVNDLFVGGDLVPVPLQDALWARLRGLGYRRILFNRRSGQPVYCLDRESVALLRHPDPDPPPQRRSRIPGPLGDLQLVDRAEPAVRPSGRFALTELGGVDLMAASMADGRARTAVVFMEAEQWLTHSSTGGVFGDLLASWVESPPVPGNLCVLVFRQRTVDEVRAFVDRLGAYPALAGLVAALQEPTGADGRAPALLSMGPPDVEELARVVHARRLGRGLVVDWAELPAVTRAMAAARAPVRAWQDRLDGVGAGAPLSLGELRERRWVPTALTDGRSAADRLAGMVGLRSVKDHVRRVGALVSWQQTEVVAGRPQDPNRLNLVFTGNPGTGKTTVARLVGELYRDAGALPIGHVHEVRPSDLVGAFQGHTQRAVEQAVEEARGGILFIDEAYGLSDEAQGSGAPSFERQAITSLVQLMDRERGNLAVIVAGYRQKMDGFLRANPGLPRRFPPHNRIDFPDYEPDELIRILLAALTRAGLGWSANFEQLLAAAVTRMRATAPDEGSGNAGDMENLAESITMHWSERTGGDPGEPLGRDDLPPEQRALLPDRDLPSVPELLAELDSMVGLESVKQVFRELAGQLRLAKRRAARGIRSEPVRAPHMLFVGPPGTGKTTVARLVGRLLCALGLLPDGAVVHASRGDLVGQYIGQTAPRTRQAVQNALGGVLFIDEAYALVSGDGFRDFGQEAVATLVEEMENRRGQFVVVAAGYPAEIDHFLASNTGLSSRFGKRVEFAGYSTAELVEVLRRSATGAGFTVDDPTARAAARWLAERRAVAGDGFGNAREVRVLLERMSAAMDARLGDADDVTDDALRIFQPQDVPHVRA